jgi:hypothetical protein
VARLRVFISHATDDTLIARRVYRRVVRAGCDAFLDVVSLRPGDVFADVIRRNLQTADEFVVIVTPRSLTRAFVWAEVGGAWMREIRMVAILSDMTVREYAANRDVPSFLLAAIAIPLAELDRYVDDLRRRNRESGG